MCKIKKKWFQKQTFSKTELKIKLHKIDIFYSRFPKGQIKFFLQTVHQTLTNHKSFSSNIIYEINLTSFFQIYFEDSKGEDINIVINSAYKNILITQFISII